MTYPMHLLEMRENSAAPGALDSMILQSVREQLERVLPNDEAVVQIGHEISKMIEAAIGQSVGEGALFTEDEMGALYDKFLNAVPVQVPFTVTVMGYPYSNVVNARWIAQNAIPLEKFKDLVRQFGILVNTVKADIEPVVKEKAKSVVIMSAGVGFLAGIAATFGAMALRRRLRG